MTQQEWNKVDAYFTGKLAPPDAVLDAALRSSAAAGLPAIAVVPNQGKMLQLFACMVGAKRIREIGALGGYSASWLATALPPDGKLITREVEKCHADVSAANIARAVLEKKVEIRVGRALDTLPKLVAEDAGPFDKVFIDADKQNSAVGETTSPPLDGGQGGATGRTDAAVVTATRVCATRWQSDGNWRGRCERDGAWTMSRGSGGRAFLRSTDVRQVL